MIYLHIVAEEQGGNEQIDLLCPAEWQIEHKDAFLPSTVAPVSGLQRFKRLQNLPEFFNGYFAQNNEVHHYNTRNTNKFHVNFSRTNYAKHSIVNKGVKIWNSLDKEISSIMFYCTFKKKGKKSKIFFL